MRRWMAVCIAVLIAFFVSPTVFGAEAEQELFVNDVRVTEANAKDVLGDGTVRCSIGTAVLSLKGAGLRKLSVKGTWTLEVTGENTVREGMTVNGNLTVRGAGCLTVTGGLNLSEGSTILPASGMRVRAGNSQNGGDAFEIENPDKEVYESAYVRLEPDYQTVRYLPDGTCTGNEQSGKHYNGMPLILPDKVYFSREGYTQTGWRDAAGGRGVQPRGFRKRRRGNNLLSRVDGQPLYRNLPVRKRRRRSCSDRCVRRGIGSARRAGEDRLPLLRLESAASRYNARAESDPTGTLEHLRPQRQYN